MSELLITQLILMLFKVLYFDVLKYTFSHFQPGMHIITSPIKEDCHSFKEHKQLGFISTKSSDIKDIFSLPSFHKKNGFKHANELFFMLRFLNLKNLQA